MGARQSRRSVDITTTSKRDENEHPVEGEGKLEKISELENKIATNGSIHNEIEYADKEETEKEDAEPAVKENGVSDSEGSKTPDADVSIGDQLNESSDLAEKSGDSTEKTEDTNENAKKSKDKSKKKKWSFRSISFSKKDKSKPGKESEKNGDVKEVNEEGAEETAATPTSPEACKTDDSPLAATPATTETEPVLTNGEVTSTPGSEAKAEEVPKPIEVVESKTDEQPVNVEPTVDEVKKDEIAVVKEESIVETPKDEPKIEVNDSKVEVEQPKVEVEEQKIVEVKPEVVAESKEVRNEEIPPPLPSSNPPSPVTVFAESTMADVPPVEQVPITAKTASPTTDCTLPVNNITPSICPDPLPPSAPILDTASKGDSSELTTQSLELASVIPNLECIKPTIIQVPAEQLTKPVTETQPEPAVELKPDLATELKPEPVTELKPEPVTELKPEPISELQPQPVVESQLELVKEPPPESVKELQPEPITDSFPEPVTETTPPMPVEELIIEPIPSPTLTNTVPEPEIEPASPNNELEPALLSNPIEQVINADSLPDISTESLPSLPEPLSESLPEPMSLPPVDCIPEPIASEVVSNSLTESEPIQNIPSESEKIQESIADIPLPNSEVILTNGDAHSPPSPVANDSTLTTPHEGPIKQVIAASEVSQGKEEERHENCDKNEISAPEPAVVEE